MLSTEIKKKYEQAMLEGIRRGRLEGKREGKLEGKREGKQEGFLQGRIFTKQENLILLVKKKYGITRSEGALIKGVKDMRKLDRAFEQLLVSDTKENILEKLK